ncbi:MAG: hypothetical protein M0D55_13155 [Elusimicrobiota bacterium]|nr:MAG: hypothetical protein M0D55_13155 [Elusimicrobiota bacterium]
MASAPCASVFGSRIKNASAAAPPHRKTSRPSSKDARTDGKRAARIKSRAGAEFRKRNSWPHWCGLKLVFSCPAGADGRTGVSGDSASARAYDGSGGYSRARLPGFPARYSDETAAYGGSS